MNKRRAKTNAIFFGWGFSIDDVARRGEAEAFRDMENSPEMVGGMLTRNKFRVDLSYVDPLLS
jgi:hypothetical protein